MQTFLGKSLGDQNVRQFLIMTGFGNESIPPFDGLFYVYRPTQGIQFSCHIGNCTISAKFPDFEYNKKNRSAPKEKVLNFRWSESDDSEKIIHNIKEFMNKVFTMIEREI